MPQHVVHIEHDSVKLPILSVCPMPILCL